MYKNKLKVGEILEYGIDKQHALKVQTNTELKG